MLIVTDFKVSISIILINSESSEMKHREFYVNFYLYLIKVHLKNQMESRNQLLKNLLFAWHYNRYKANVWYEGLQLKFQNHQGYPCLLLHSLSLSVPREKSRIPRLGTDLLPVVGQG